MVASFYPLQFVTEQVGGDEVAVSNATKAGVEPHDLELSAQDTAQLIDSDLVVFLSGFQPAVDDAVESLDAEALDVAGSADLNLQYTPIADGQPEPDETGTDPHFWLDPLRLADVGDSVAAKLGELAPESAASFEANANQFRNQLEALNNEYASALRECDQRDLVTSHNAFGYLAQAFDLQQVGITGLTPETEPSPQELAAVADFVKENEVSTIYYETLVSPDVAETLADSTGASTAVLDPLEGLADETSGDDYFDVMRANLNALKTGLTCRLAAPYLDLADATIGYDSVAVLTRVNLSISAGEFVGVVGPNGSGKSTLIKAFVGLADCIEGEYNAFGLDAGNLQAALAHRLRATTSDADRSSARDCRRGRGQWSAGQVTLVPTAKPARP